VKVGDLVKVKDAAGFYGSEGLFIITAIGKKQTLANERWAEILSLSTLERSYEIIRSLEVINENR
jgi:hypothetical protein